VTSAGPQAGLYKRQCGRSPRRSRLISYAQILCPSFSSEMLGDRFDDDVLDIGCRNSGHRSDLGRLGLSMQARQRHIIAIPDAGLGHRGYVLSTRRPDYGSQAKRLSPGTRSGGGNQHPTQRLAAWRCVIGKQDGRLNAMHHRFGRLLPDPRSRPASRRRM
jgi:hypothetical protein